MAQKWTGVINCLKIITSKPNNTIKSCDYAHKVPCNLKSLVNNTSRRFFIILSFVHVKITACCGKF